MNEDDLLKALGDLCPRCGAVLRETYRVLKTSGGRKVETPMLKCDYCGYKEDV